MTLSTRKTQRIVALPPTVVVPPTAAQSRSAKAERREQRDDDQSDNGEHRSVALEPVRPSSNRQGNAEGEDDEPDGSVDDSGWILAVVHGRVGGRPPRGGRPPVVY